MGNFKLTVLVLFFLSAGTIAQSQVPEKLDSTKSDSASGILICKQVPVSPEKQPLFIISIKDQEFRLLSNVLEKLDINWIEHLNVSKDIKETAKYGPAGANGVILITIKRYKQGDVLKIIEKHTEVTN